MFPMGDEKVAEKEGPQSTWGHHVWENRMDRRPNPAHLSQAHGLWERLAKKLLFCWTYCCEVVSLDLLGSHMGPESIAHREGSKAERWTVPEIFSP